MLQLSKWGIFFFSLSKQGFLGFKLMLELLDLKLLLTLLFLFLLKGLNLLLVFLDLLLMQLSQLLLLVLIVGFFDFLLLKTPVNAL